MKQLVIRTFSLATLLIATAFLYGVNGQTVSGSIGDGRVTRGKTTRATVVLTIPSDLHVNSSRPGSEYAIPTNVKATGKGVRIGAVNYPRGRNRKFSFSENSINVYEGRPAFKFNVTVPANYKGNSVTVNVAVRYQACNDEVCYPPKTKQLTLTAAVK